MPADLRNFSYKYDASGSATLRLRSTQLGDGYEERRVDGINPVRETWDVVFIFSNDMLGMRNLLNILNDLKGGWVYWANPIDTTLKRWTVDNWDILITSPNYGEVSVQLKLWNGL